MSWRQENDFKHENGKYKSKYKEVQNEIVENAKRHEAYLDVDYEEMESYNFLNSDDDSDNEDFSMLNPRLFDFGETRHDSVSSGSISTTAMVDMQLPNEIQYVQSAT